MQRLLTMQRRPGDGDGGAVRSQPPVEFADRARCADGARQPPGFDRVLHEQIRLARRESKPLTLMMCDIDFFKQYNDNLGHPEG